MGTKILIRQDIEANWVVNNPVVAAGEWAYSTDTKRVKLGDGSTSWNSLVYDANKAVDIESIVSHDNLQNINANQHIDWTLTAGATIHVDNLPPITITDTFVVANETAMLALIAQTGDVAVRSDEKKTYILKGTAPTLLSNWEWLQSPTDLVLSVAGKTGAVTLDMADITDAGTAATADVTTSATDTTAGRVLKVGDFGVGAYSSQLITASQVEIDDYSFGANGATYRVVSPTGVSAGTYLLKINRSSASNSVFQELMTMNVSNSKYTRMMNNSTGVTPWEEIWHSGNLNFRKFSSNGVSGRIIATGFARSATEAVFQFHVGYTEAVSILDILVTSTFSIQTYAVGVNVATNIQGIQMSLLSNGGVTALIRIGSLSGLTGGDGLYLITETTTSEIEFI